MNFHSTGADHTVKVRADQIDELVELLQGYSEKRAQIDEFNESPFPEYSIAGIAVSAEAVAAGLQAELDQRETRLLNRFNIVIGAPLPKVPFAVAVPNEEASTELACANAITGSVSSELAVDLADLYGTNVEGG
jgi:hypothetical protein